MNHQVSSNDRFISGFPIQWINPAKKPDQSLDFAHYQLVYHGYDQQIKLCPLVDPDAPCMEYLPTFTTKITQMWVNIPYMEHLG